MTKAEFAGLLVFGCACSGPPERGDDGGGVGECRFSGVGFPTVGAALAFAEGAARELTSGAGSGSVRSAEAVGDTFVAGIAELGGVAVGALDGAELAVALARGTPTNRIIETTAVIVTAKTARVQRTWARRVCGRTFRKVVVDGVPGAGCVTSMSAVGTPRDGVDMARSSADSVPSYVDIRLPPVDSTPQMNRNVSAASAIVGKRSSSFRLAARANHSSKPGGT